MIRPAIGEAGIQTGIDAFRHCYQREGIFWNSLYPGVLSLLQALRAAGRPSWIVTSKPEPQAERVAELLDLAPLLAGVIGAGPAETETKTELIAHALAASGAKPAATLMLGDRHYDVIGARENRGRRSVPSGSMAPWPN